jgi:VCBS repeat-containing protein
LTITGVTPGANGTVVVNPDGTLAYIPNPGFNGTRQLHLHHHGWQRRDIRRHGRVTVGGDNRAPLARNDTVAAFEDNASPSTCWAMTAIPTATVTITGVTQGADGSVLLNADGTLTYSPGPDFNGIDTFTYTIADGRGGTSTATVTVVVAGINDPPVARDDTATVAEDGQVTFNVLANDSDVDGDPVTITAVTQGPTAPSSSIPTAR